MTSGQASRHLWRVFISLVVFATTGCAYHYGIADRALPGGYRMVAVPVFKNSTPEVGIEVPFTNAMIRELQRTRVGQLADKNSAQVTLEGTIDSVQYLETVQVVPQPVSTSGQSSGPAVGNVLLPQPQSQPSIVNGEVLNSQYRILLQATLRLRRNSDQKIIWSGTFNNERSYLAPQIGVPGLETADALYNQSAHWQNIEQMATDLMAEAHDQMTENF